MDSASRRERSWGAGAKGATTSIATDGGGGKIGGGIKDPENWWTQVGREG